VTTATRQFTLWRRALALPLVIALPPLLWVIDATHRASLTTLGRDQGIFQYVAWALRHGAVDYRDVRDVNGPLTHLIHVVMLALGGGDEHRFHVIDLVVTGATFAFAGACLPGVARRSPPALLERLGWAFAAWVVLSGQYLMYLYWDLAQRESFFDWFMLSGVALQLWAQRSLGGPVRHDESFANAMRRGWLLAVCGALLAIPWFGKPTYVIFSVVQVVAIALDRELSLTRRRALAIFAIGSLAGLLSQFAFLVAYGDVGAFVRIYLVDVPAMYRFMLPRTSVEILSLEWGGKTAALAFATGVAHIGLVIDGQMPRRTVSLALVPVAGIVSVIMQAKGFPYHFHPVTAALHLEWLLLVVWLWERFRATPRRRVFARMVPYLAGTALAVKIATYLTTSPHVQNLWILSKARDAAERSSHDYLVYFRDGDYFPWELRQTAAYLKAHTKPEDRVQIYGMDSYLLFLAERLSATPYIYVYDLNADAALGGSWLPDGPHPNAAQAAVIRRMRDEHERDMLTRVKKEPPAAFVFFDKSPLTSNGDSFADFSEHCPESAAWVREHYRETASFGEDHVWMRLDLAPSPDRHENEPKTPL
jgi:hypothetical protein